MRGRRWNRGKGLGRIHRGTKTEARSAGIPEVRAARSAAVARGKASGDILAFDTVVTRGEVVGVDGLASVGERCGALGPAEALEEVEAKDGDEVEANNKEDIPSTG